MFESITKLASGRNVLLALIIMMLGTSWLFNAGPYSELPSFGAGNAPEESIAIAADLGDYLADLGEGRSTYRSHLFWDFLNPALMVPFFTLLMGWLLQKNTLAHRWRYILAIPLLIAAAEIVENGLLLVAVQRFPEPAIALPLLTMSTALKFASLIACVLLGIGLGLLAIASRLRGTGNS